MKKVNVNEAKAKLSELLKLIEKGESFVICKYNIPVAQVNPATFTTDMLERKMNENPLKEARIFDEEPKNVKTEIKKRKMGGLSHLAFDIPDSAFFDPMPDDFLEYFS